MHFNYLISWAFSFLSICYILLCKNSETQVFVSTVLFIFFNMTKYMTRSQNWRRLSQNKIEPGENSLDIHWITIINTSIMISHYWNISTQIFSSIHVSGHSWFSTVKKGRLYRNMKCQIFHLKNKIKLLSGFNVPRRKDYTTNNTRKPRQISSCNE